MMSSRFGEKTPNGIFFQNHPPYFLKMPPGALTPVTTAWIRWRTWPKITFLREKREIKRASFLHR
ncbi:MAG: hypothetical protein J7L66_05955, partial [Anaerolineaceae bacterium]|nr:hypothetical protein [Anaerolineaceae bacterium]